MKTVLVASLASFAVGACVGIVYAMLRVKAPAPPIVALVGLLGMVLGEQIPAWVHWFQASRVSVADAPSIKDIFMESSH